MTSEARIVLFLLAVFFSSHSKAGCLTSKSAPQECTVAQHALVGSLAATASDMAFDNPWYGAWAALAIGTAREATQNEWGESSSLQDIAGFAVGGFLTAWAIDSGYFDENDMAERFRLVQTVDDIEVQFGIQYEWRW